MVKFPLKNVKTFQIYETKPKNGGKPFYHEKYVEIWCTYGWFFENMDAKQRVQEKNEKKIKHFFRADTPPRYGLQTVRIFGFLLILQ